VYNFINFEIILFNYPLQFSFKEYKFQRSVQDRLKKELLMPPNFKIYEYKGQDIIVRYDNNRCIHAAECTGGLPAVFVRGGRPWVQPDQVTADQVAGVIMRCPSGALKFERLDKGPAEPTPTETTIYPVEDGPLYMRGDLTITTPDGEMHRDTRIAFCRCGASHNKPFCDRSHEGIGFKAETW
jgi:uncharacterized Fe-S cluster protein YjdI